MALAGSNLERRKLLLAMGFNEDSAIDGARLEQLFDNHIPVLVSDEGQINGPALDAFEGIVANYLINADADPESTFRQQQDARRRNITWSFKDDFGAVGDGVANDQPAFDRMKTAIESANLLGAGTHVHFGRGTYKFDRVTVNASKMAFTADEGAILLSTQDVTSTAPTVSLKGDYVTVDDLRIDHISKPNLDTFQKATDDGAHGLLITSNGTKDNYGKYCRVNRVKSHNCWFSGIVVRFFQSVVISQCDIYNAPATGLFIVSNDDVSITDNVVKLTGDDAIFAGKTSNATFPQCRRVVVTGNSISDAQAKGIGFTGVYGGVIANNTIENTTSNGIRCYGGAQNGLGPTSFCIIANNTLIGAGFNYGSTRFPTINADSHGISAAGGSTDTLILGNILEGVAGDGIFAIGGTNPGGNARLIISMNRIRDVVTGVGINIGSGSGIVDAMLDILISLNILDGINSDGINLSRIQRGKVVNNMIKTWGRTATGTRRALSLNNCEYSEISNNTLFNDAVSASTKQWMFITGTTVYREFNNVRLSPTSDRGGSGFNLGDKLVMLGTAAPTTGTWNVGDFIFNAAPAESGSVGAKHVIHGWRCVTAGNPGVWVPLYARTEVPTAAGASPFQLARKTTPSVYNGVTTVAADAELTLPVVPGIYRVEATIDYDAAIEADAKFSFSVPAGSSGRWATVGLAPNATNAQGNINASSSSFVGGEKIIGAAGAGSAMAVLIDGLLIVANAGSLTLQHAQGQPGQSTDTTIRSGSWLMLTKVG